jgi:hypothetical protein
MAFWYTAQKVNAWQLPILELKTWTRFRHINQSAHLVPPQCTSSTSGLYYNKKMIINDDYRVVNKLETSLSDVARVVIYDRHMFMVQATGLKFGGMVSVLNIEWGTIMQQNTFKIVKNYTNIYSYYGARYLMGENLKLVWTEFSTLS